MGNRKRYLEVPTRHNMQPGETGIASAARLKAVTRCHGVAEFALDGTVISANEQYLTILGYGRAEVVGRHHSIFVSRKYRNSAEYRAFWTTLAAGNCITSEFLRFGKGGRQVWLSASYNPVFNFQGKPVSILNVARDITAAKAADLDCSSQIRALNRSLSIMEFMLDGTIINVNSNYLAIMGYEAEEVIGRHHEMFVSDYYRVSADYAEFWSDLRSGAFKSAEFLRLGRDGRQVWLQATYNPIIGCDGQITKIVKFASDITASKRQSLDSTSQLEAIARTQLVAEFALDETVLAINENFRRITGYLATELIGQPHSIFVSLGQHGAITSEDLWRDLRAGQFRTGEFPFIDKHGNTVWLQATYTPIHGLDGALVKVVMFASDISARKSFETQLDYAARHDHLTGLFNRAAFDTRFASAIEAARRTKTEFSLLCLDLDRFKNINDLRGHAAGDMLLVEVATRLRGLLRANDVCARLGGDEFVIILDLVNDIETLEVVTRRVIGAVRMPFVIDGAAAVIGVSIGAARYPIDGQDSETLLRNADIALYQAKADGRNTWRAYQPALARQAQSRTRLEHDLRSAIELTQFSILYQPICDAITGVSVAYEALVRWHHPSLGVISPADFIPIAEESGLILPLGLWIAKTACAEAATWAWPARVAINLSPLQLRSQTTVENFAAILSATSLPASRLDLEVTESVLLDDHSPALATLQSLQALGARE